MRYQQYKNRMLKIRKVIDFFYRFRFVFAGAIAIIVAGSITLDATRGNITETTEFKTVYTYGEEISYSGTAFMGKVTYEFRRKNTGEDWSEETPIYPGEYEARAKSQGSHGYKYSEESTFEIKPYETEFKIKNDKIGFAEKSPALDYSLLPGDRLENYKVTYADRTVNKTTASIDENSIQIFNKNNDNVTNCYSFTCVDKEIEFIPEKLTFTFKNSGNFTFTGDETHPFTANEYDMTGEILDDAYPVVTGKSRVNVGSEDNRHEISIVDAQGKDYTVNYDIVIAKENKINVTKAAPLVITSSSMEKTYDDQPFDENDFYYSAPNLLTNIHEITDVTFDYTNVKTCDEATHLANTFSYNIRDKRTREIIDPEDYYQSFAVVNGDINIKKIPIIINTPNVNHSFDNKDVNGYEGGEVSFDGDLFGDDFIKVNTFTTENEPGTYENQYGCGVYRKMMVDSVLTDVDVSSNYDISYNNGNINIEVSPIVIKFDGQDLPYNGAPQNVYQNDNHGYISSGSLPTGWTYTAVIYEDLNSHNPFTMTNVKANDGTYKGKEAQVDVVILDEHGIPMTEYYTIDRNESHDNDANCDVTFLFEESRVTKVDLAVTVIDFDPIEYNQMTLEQNLDLNSRVSSVGLKGTDEVVVTYSDNDQKKIKNASATPYSVGLNIDVINSSTGLSSASNYNIDFNRVEPITSSVRINRKNVTIHTPDISMVYSDSSMIPQKNMDFSSVEILDEYGYPISGLKVRFNKDKNYFADSSSAGTNAFDNIDQDDLIIYDESTEEVYHNVYNPTGALDNYNINLINDGAVYITPRLIEIYQKDDESKDHIFYDGNYHGVFNGSLEIDYTHEDNNQEIGLLSSKNHVLNFTDAKSKNTANEPGEATLYGNGVIDKTAYYGTKILKNNDPTKDMTSNYDIRYVDDYIRINIIKKRIDIISLGDKKVFDGSEFYKLITWTDIDTLEGTEFTHTVTRYDDNLHSYVNTELDAGDKIQIRRVNTTLSDNSVNVGNHTNEFEWRILDSTNNYKETGFYNVSTSYGTLSVKKLYVDFGIDHREKEYDSNNITFPNGQAIDAYDGTQISVTENSREQGVYLTYRPVYDLDGPDPSKVISFNKQAFENNYSTVARIYKGSYPKFYLANSDDPASPYYYAYKFNVYTYLFLKGTNTSYTEPSNVELNFDSTVLNYRVTKPRIDLQSTAITTTLELRMIVGGSLRGNDTLYFGTEKYTTQAGKKPKPKQWASAFIRSNVHIYRNDNPEDEVTDCYTIVM